MIEKKVMVNIEGLGMVMVTCAGLAFSDDGELYNTTDIAKCLTWEEYNEKVEYFNKKFNGNNQKQSIKGD